MRLLLVVVAIATCQTVHAQKVGPVEVKEMPGGYGMKKIAESPRKVFIQSFKVNYQIFFSQTEFEAGSNHTLGGGVRGDVKASVGVLMDGISEKALIESTDRMYKELLDRLAREGYEVLPIESALGIKEYEGWERMKGGKASKAQFQGYVSVSPTDLEYFVRKVSDNGKERGTFLENGGRISKELNEALVLKVTITIPFCRDGESTGSKLLGKISKGIVNVAVETGARLSKDMVNTSSASNSGATSFLAFRTGSKFKDESVGVWTLKDDVEIEGAVDKKLFKEGAVANTDVMGMDMGLVTLYSAENISATKMHKFPVDVPTYQRGVEEGGKKFISAVMDEIMRYAKR